MYGIVNKLENTHPDAAFVVLGDFNRANMKNVLPKYYQHVSLPTRGEHTLDHCYTPFRNGYKPLLRPAFDKSDHSAILLLPAYKQRLKLEKTVSRQVHRWSRTSDEVLQDCFETTDWQMFAHAADGDINAYTDSVVGYIGKCIEDTVPQTTICTYPNQKPWAGPELRAKLKARTAAFNSGDPDAYKAAKYDVRRTIRASQRKYKEKVESAQQSHDSRRVWHGLRCITDYGGRSRPIELSSSSFPDELNTFYARFDADNTTPATRPLVDSEDAVLCLNTAMVRQALKKVNPRKAPGPDGIPGRVLRVCADQLAEVFTDIFNLSLSQSTVPTIFKTSTIVPIPKTPTASCPNDYRPIALTSVVMKCFERIIKRHICGSLPNNLDPLQFAYRAKRSTDDAIALATHTALSHLEKGNTYVRMLFIDYSSAFNTVIPSKLVSKLTALGLEKSICSWIWDFLSNRPQAVRIGNHLSSTVVLSTGTPQGCVLSPLLYSLFTHDCSNKHNSNLILKFADDTTIIGLITNNDESAYRDEVTSLTSWCQENNLSLNVSKTKEMIVDFRRQRVDQHLPLHINSTVVEQVSSFRFLGVHITEDLSWTQHADSVVKKARQRLYFLRRLRKFSMNTNTLTNFYRCTIESLLTGSITVWYGNCTAHSRKALQRVVRTAEDITGSSLPSIQDIYHSRCLRKAHSITKDHTHPAHGLFRLLPSGRRYRSLPARTKRLKDSYYPQAVRSLNSEMTPVQ